ncbi:MAG: hypothetical protein P4L79_02515 [Legionella sp.]|uniref:hypothetical protein n=1 Tax=Legionella sp. TaxID=459 RepID=UPI00285248C6|nr:hypothetical protein [Legionella sp.]
MRHAVEEIMGIIIILLMFPFTWFVLSSIVNKTSALHLGLRLSVLALILVFSPLIAELSYDAYSALSRSLFVMSADGKIQLQHSPFTVPPGKNKEYCAQFKDHEGKPIYITSISDNEEDYCGEFWGLDYQKIIFLPYKLLGNNKAIYWASPELQIIVPVPGHF